MANNRDMMTARDLTETEWKPMARYSNTKALTYLEDAPQGRGPWFLATINEIEEFADYRDAVKAFSKR